MRHEENEHDLPNLPKGLYKLLLIVDAVAIIVSMVAGPLDYAEISIGAAASAIFLSLCLLLYGMAVWVRGDHQ